MALQGPSMVFFRNKRIIPSWIAGTLAVMSQP